MLEVLDALKAADVDDRVRQAAETIYQALIEPELTAVIDAAPFQRTDQRTAQRNRLGWEQTGSSSPPPRALNRSHLR